MQVKGLSVSIVWELYLRKDYAILIWDSLNFVGKIHTHTHIVWRMADQSEISQARHSGKSQCCSFECKGSLE